MRLDIAERDRVAIGAANMIVTLNQLVNIIIDTCLAEPLMTIAALCRIFHQGFTQNAVEQGVMLLLNWFFW